MLKLKTMPVQLPLSTPNCTARMELGVCETCYDYLLFGKDRVLFGDRKLQEHFAFQVSVHTKLHDHQLRPVESS